MRVWTAVILFACAWTGSLHPSSAWALGPDALQDALQDGGEARVRAVIDGDTVVLDDGREIRLVGVQAPKRPLGRKDFKAWPLAEDAKAFVERWALDRAVRVRLGAQPQDRHGRVLAHLVRADDGAWLQGALLEAGLARVYTFADNRGLAAAMLALEDQARGRGAGLWALAPYAVRTPETVGQDVGDFQLVEGRILDAARVKDRIYLNFGADWRTDFTVKVAARDERLFVQDGLDLTALSGRRVRVRGWVKSENGPMIELDHPERLELLQP